MRFFFYGTLRTGHGPPPIAHVLRTARTLGPGRVRGRLYDLGAYPGGIPDEQAPTTIPGSVFELPDDPELLRDLDAYEEFDPQRTDASLFLRTEGEVELEDGRRISCWMYVYNRVPEGREPMTGDQGWTGHGSPARAHEPESRHADEPL
jgi:gamma-glutamylcyclotransferase (GGCT)/AIG2-like uncharacterized protein YtfP